MPPMPDPEPENSSPSDRPDSGQKKETAGRTLKRIFRQEDRLGKVEVQTAERSLLMKPLRLSIFIHLCHNPCDHTRSVARAMGRSTSSVNWNLGQLLRAGYLESADLDGQKIYWPKGMIESGDVRSVSAARAEKPIKILKAIHRLGGRARQRDITAALGTGQQAADFWLRKMVSVGILDRTEGAVHPEYSVSGEFLETVRRYRALAKPFSEKIMLLLRTDGLMPRHRRLRASRLSFDIRLPSGSERLHIECNPLAPLAYLLDA